MTYRNCYGVEFDKGDSVTYQTIRGESRTDVVRSVRNEGFNGVVVTMVSGATCAPQDIALADVKSANDAFKKGLSMKAKIHHGKDIGFLQHGTAPGPCRTEWVIVKPAEWPRVGEWLAHYEGRWRLVHTQVKRLYIVCHGKRITIQIEGV